MRKHTPTPWYTTTDEPGTAGADSEGCPIVATVGTFSIYTKNATTAHHEVDAALIAAAPELLQACKDAAKLCELAYSYFPTSILNGDRFQLLNIEANSIKKAIRKATGDST